MAAASAAAVSFASGSSSNVKVEDGGLAAVIVPNNAQSEKRAVPVAVPASDAASQVKRRGSGKLFCPS